MTKLKRRDINIETTNKISTEITDSLVEILNRIQKGE